MLTGSLLVDGVKMSKSLGNFRTVKDALKSYKAEALRFFILSGKYNSPADYSDGALQAASKGWDRLNNGQRRVQDALKQGDLQLSEDSTPAMTANLIETLDQYRMRFVSAMNDDFNTPLALGALQDMTTDVNRWLDKGIAAPEVLEQIANIYKELAGDVLGVVRDQAATSDAGSAEREAALIEMMIQMRADARKAKDFARADEIRKRLTEIGVTLEDGPKGTSWKVG